MNTSNLEASFAVRFLDFVPTDKMYLFQVSSPSFPQKFFEETFNLADDCNGGQKNRGLVNGDAVKNRFQ